MILVVWIQDVGGFDIINFEIRISKSTRLSRSTLSSPPMGSSQAETNLIMRDMIVKLYRVFVLETCAISNHIDTPVAG
jgi:hypothetical protein